AVAGQSVVKLYAAAMFPGFFLAFLYLVYIVGWAIINPKIAPRLPEEQLRVPVPAWVEKFQAAYVHRNMLAAFGSSLISPLQARQIEADGKRLNYRALVKNFSIALVPLTMTVVCLGVVWWYVVIHQQAAAEIVTELQPLGTPGLEAKEPSPSELGPSTAFYVWFW